MQVIKGMPMEQYLALPAVSASIVKETVENCAKAGWAQSWLNPKRVVETSDVTDIGTICHSMLLEGGPGKILVIDPEDYPAKNGNVPTGWTNGAIREARDAARLAGKIPVLPEDMEGVEAMVDSAAEYIESLRDTEPAVYALFQEGGGDSELTLTWDEDGVPCRARPDRIATDRRLTVDIKTTTKSANPDAWEVDHVGAAWYRRGGAACFGEQMDYLFFVIEQTPPYLCSLVGTDPHGFSLGEEKIALALQIWRQCVKAGKWPGFANRVAYPEIKPWVDTKWADKQALYMGLEFYDTQFHDLRRKA